MKFISVLLVAMITTTGISSGSTSNVQDKSFIDKDKAAELVNLSEGLKRLDEDFMQEISYGLF